MPGKLTGFEPDPDQPAELEQGAEQGTGQPEPAPDLEPEQGADGGAGEPPADLGD